MIFEGDLNSFDDIYSEIEKLRAFGYFLAEYDYSNCLNNNSWKDYLSNYEFGQSIIFHTASQLNDISYGDYISINNQFDSSWYILNARITYPNEDIYDYSLSHYYMGSSNSIECFADNSTAFLSFTVPIEKNALNENQKIKYNSSAFICSLSDKIFDDSYIFSQAFKFEWYVNGVLAEDTANIYVGDDGKYICLKDLKNDVKIRHKVSDFYGNTIYDSGEINLEVKNSFFDKIVYFIKSLFGYNGEVFVACKSDMVSENVDLDWYTTEKDGKEEFNWYYFE